MARTWKLETSTKGTGATVVPLGGDATERDRERELQLVVPAPRERDREQAPPAPPPPRRFRVADVMTGELLADDVPLRAAVDALGRVRSPVDVTVSVYNDAGGRWRLLTRREQAALWRHRPAPPR